jgi:DNA-binding MarR family transcriptional regulator
VSETKPDPPLDSPPADVARLAAQLRALVMRRSDAWLDLDITMPQLRALFCISRQQPMSVSALADALEQRLAAVSALVTRLVRAGLVRRREDPDDHRRVLLEVTDRGARMVSGVDSRAADRFEAVLAQMSPRGRHCMAVALSELIDLLSAQPPSDEGTST